MCPEGQVCRTSYWYIKEIIKQKSTLGYFIFNSIAAISVVYIYIHIYTFHKILFFAQNKKLNWGVWKEKHLLWCNMCSLTVIVPCGPGLSAFFHSMSPVLRLSIGKHIMHSQQLLDLCKPSLCTPGAPSGSREKCCGCLFLLTVEALFHHLLVPCHLSSLHHYKVMPKRKE